MEESKEHPCVMDHAQAMALHRSMEALQLQVEQYKQQWQDMQQSRDTYRLRMEEHKSAADNAMDELEQLRAQCSRELAERDWAYSQLRQDFDRTQLRLMRVEGHGSIDKDEAVWVACIEGLKSEKRVLTTQRDLFASELDSLVSHFDSQSLFVQSLEEETCSLRAQLSAASRALAESQEAVARGKDAMETLARERDAGVIRALQMQVSEMERRLERSDRDNARLAQAHADAVRDAQVQVHAKAAVARAMEEAELLRAAKAASLDAQCLRMSQTARSTLSAAAVASQSVAGGVEQAVEQASRKRKEREAALEIEEAQAREEKKKARAEAKKAAAAAATAAAMAAEADTKQSKKASKAAAAASASSSSSSSDPAADAASTKKGRPKAKKTRRAKAAESEEEEEAEDEAAEEELEEEDPTERIAAKWNIKGGAMGKKKTAAPTPSVTSARRGSLDSLSLSPIISPRHRSAVVAPAPSAAAAVSSLASSSSSSSHPSDLTSRLAETEASLALDASVQSLNESTSSGSDGSFSSGVSATSTEQAARRRALFPNSKRSATLLAQQKAAAAMAKGGAPPIVVPIRSATQQQQQQQQQRWPLQSVSTQAQAAPAAVPSAAHAPLLLQKAYVPPTSSRPLVGLPPAPPATASGAAGGARNLFLHFLQGGIKVPKIRQQ